MVVDPRATVDSCDRCPTTGLDVLPTTIDGERLLLCAACSVREAVDGGELA